MRQVQDLFFLESLEFRVDELSAARAKAGTFSMGEVAINLCALAGLELVDYDTIMMQPSPGSAFVHVQLKSRAWRERWQRSADFSRR